MESAKTQKWLPEEEEAEAEFVPFFPSASETKESEVFGPAPIQANGSSSFRSNEDVWKSLSSDPIIREEIELRVSEALRLKLESELIEEKRAFLERGRLEGLEQGRQESAEELRQIKARVEVLCREIVEEKKELLESHSVLWMRLVRHLMQRFLVPSATKITLELEKWLTQSLSEFSKSGKVKISVSSSDYDRLEGIRLRTGEDQSWSLAIDSSLSPGEIHCECGEGGVFFSREEQLEKLDQWIEQYFPDLVSEKVVA